MLKVKVLRPTQHKIGHFRDAPQASLLAWYGKKQNLHNKSTHSLIKRNVLQHKLLLLHPFNGLFPGQPG